MRYLHRWLRSRGSPRMPLTGSRRGHRSQIEGNRYASVRSTASGKSGFSMERELESTGSPAATSSTPASVASPFTAPSMPAALASSPSCPSIADTKPVPPVWSTIPRGRMIHRLSMTGGVLDPCGFSHRRSPGSLLCSAYGYATASSARALVSRSAPPVPQGCGRGCDDRHHVRPWVGDGEVQPER